MNKTWIYAGIAVAAGVGAVGLVKVFSGPKLRPGQTRLFLVGDSLAVGLAPHLKAMSGESRIAFDFLAKEGTRIDQWANSQVLQERLKAFKPTLVLISLGTNDEYLSEGAPARQAPYLESLLTNVKAVAPEAVWIGPPKLPKATNGMVGLIRSRVPESHYFPSDNLEIVRGPDGLHPTARGYAAWAGSIWRWLS